MKKLVAWIFAIMFTAPVMAADGAVSRALPASGTTKADVVSVASGRGNSVGVSRTASRSVASASPKDTSAATATRTATRVAAGSASRDATPSRSMSARMSAAADATTARDNLNAAVSTVGRNARVSAASINSSPALRRAGITLRPSTAEVGGRATIAGTDVQTGSNIGESVRALQSRAATTATRESIAEAKERLEQTSSLNKSCQEQYNECMDQFCTVIDSNQKRCSCSGNLSHYTKVETAVKDANTQLNEVAQRIRYVGLSADEISAIMSATEAEEALSGARDTTETRSMLDDIAALIKDPAVTTASGTDSFSSLELDLDFSDTSNMFSLDFLNNNTGSLSNLRGAELYSAAKKRCSTILSQCKDAGASQQQLTSNYDLAIDRDCIAYEQGLNKMNETLVANVRSANLMLQKARLAVMQNKNQYDAKGCIAALDACMTDDMVCGENYEKCLDPTKRFIDENGEVVVGQDITYIRDFMVSYDNSKIKEDFLENAVVGPADVANCSRNIDGKYKGVWRANGDSWCTVKHLLQKIGTSQSSNDGLCRPVLDKCQRYTYNDDTYRPYNDIVLNYIQRALVNIKAAQEKIISEYASTCIVDVATCYNQQVSQVNAWASNASASSIRGVMRGACRNVALTCGYAIYDGCTERAYKETLASGDGLQREPAEGTENPPTNGAEPSGLSTMIEEFISPIGITATNNWIDLGEDCPQSDAEVIERISQIFYSSMLCPANSTYDVNCAEGRANCVNDVCRCNTKTGYTLQNGQCKR